MTAPGGQTRLEEEVCGVLCHVLQPGVDGEVELAERAGGVERPPVRVHRRLLRLRLRPQESHEVGDEELGTAGKKKVWFWESIMARVRIGGGKVW